MFLLASAVTTGRFLIFDKSENFLPDEVVEFNLLVNHMSHKSFSHAVIAMAETYKMGIAERDMLFWVVYF